MSSADNNTKSGDQYDPGPKEGRVLRVYRISVELVKALLWPSVTIYIFLALKLPLTALLAELPVLVSKSTKLTIASVSVEIGQRLKEEASPELRSALADVSPGALRMLIDTGTTTRFLDKSWEDYNQDTVLVQELEKKGLMKTQKPTEKPYELEYELTDLGTKAYELIQQVMIDQLLKKN